MKTTPKSFRLLATCLTLALLLMSGCVQEVVQQEDEYRGDLVLKEVITTDPLELRAEPLDFDRAMPADSTGHIVVIKSERYEGFDPAHQDTVQVVLRYSHGVRFLMDSATLTD